MNSRTIGKITSIGIRGIIADVYDDLGNYINTMDGITKIIINIGNNTSNSYR